ncbi:DUF4019 domain-containing protein [Aestuariibacter sp. AA17]|uniref:DUF4019 domain-containing protein n=1 Tax=Fluctibacter corallii TaxID=2984329 RepID=A0ABT3A7R4_9ALTE|nr:DUF4019 domain-containing protein [Aestuariibacter sp. AA17]MCV2884729.1 DUF4019 domain-containing protein [Aestuariibacter sp. AA17]
MKILFLILLTTFSVFSYSGDKDKTDSAMSWLALVDSKDYTSSWEQAAPFFQAQISSAQWIETIEEIRTPLGKVVSREITGSSNQKALPGAPEGEYLVLTLSTDYTHKSDATETVVLSKVDRDWRVVGYFIN